MEANLCGARAVKEERRSGFNHVPSQFIPRIPFREDVLRQALGTIPTVGFLDNFECQLSHIHIIRQ